MKKYTYGVKGLHCASCVLVIEGQLEKEKGVKTVNVDLKKQEITIDSKKIISTARLNRIFKNNGYKFIEEELNEEDGTVSITNGDLWWLWAILIISGFLILSKIGLGGFLNIDAGSSLVAIFIFGLIAGFSSCGALLSGIILTSPQNTKKILLGRIVSYSVLGAVLGLVGQRVAVSPTVTSVLMVLVSLIMVVVALQMLEIKFARQINLFLPKSLGKKITNNQVPFAVGLLTVFLPCGFTLLTESVAVLSGDILKGFLIMLVFVIGSSIPLFLIGLSSEKLVKNQKLIGALILFFVLYNLNFQFNLGQYLGAGPEGNKYQETKNEEVIKLTYSSFGGLNPYQTIVKKGQKVRLEIEALTDEYGCMSTILLPKLFEKPQTITAGKIIVMEFTPQKSGIYQFACAMGVPHKGEINVVE